jgi:putative ABC transport system substrate-binding protein
MIARREFIALLGGAAAAWPVAAKAQQPPMPVIGFLSSRSPGESAAVVTAFRKGLSETGFIEGQNAIIAFRWAEGHYERLPSLASDLVALNVAVLFAAGGPPSALAAKTATSTIPIVFSATSDPVRFGLVASLNRPGANITGMSTLVPELTGKTIEILREMVPAAAVIAYLINPSNPTSPILSKSNLIEGSAGCGQLFGH